MYEEMDVAEVLNLMDNTVQEIGWTKNTQKKLSKVHKKEAQTLLDMETMLEKLSLFIEQKRAKVRKLAKPQYFCYDRVQQCFDDTSCTISNLQRDIRTLRAEAEKKEKMLRECAKALDNGVATADEVVAAKVKHGQSLAEMEFWNKEEALRNKERKQKKSGKRRHMPKHDPEAIKEKYIKCHERADMHFSSTLLSAEASLKAAKKISTDSKRRTCRSKATTTQEVQTVFSFATKLAPTDNSALPQKHSVERDDVTSLQMAAEDPEPEPSDILKPDNSYSHCIFEFTNVVRGARQASEDSPDDLLSLTESEIDFPEIDQPAQGDSSLCVATDFNNNHDWHKYWELTQKRGHVLEVPLALPGAVGDS